MFNCVVDQVMVEPISIGMRVRARLLAGNGEAPRVYPFDGFRLDFVKTASSPTMPSVPSGMQQVLNGAVIEAAIVDQADGSAVSLLLEGVAAAVPDMHPGDALQATLTRTSAGQGSPVDAEPWKVMSW